MVWRVLYKIRPISCYFYTDLCLTCFSMPASNSRHIFPIILHSFSAGNLKMLTVLNEPNKEWKHPFKCRLWLTFGCVFLLGCKLDSSSQAELIMGQPVLTVHFSSFSPMSHRLFVIPKCHIFWTLVISMLLKSCMWMEWDVWDKLNKITRNWKLL